jgi:hypothetical protein
MEIDRAVETLTSVLQLLIRPAAGTPVSLPLRGPVRQAYAETARRQASTA